MPQLNWLLQRVSAMVRDEVSAYDHVLALKSADIAALQDAVRVSSKEEALVRGVVTVQTLMSALTENGITFDKTDPGHGLGHILRDYVAGVRLVKALNLSPKALFAGLVAGVFHDVGCTVVGRYHDAKTPVRHAEVAALMIGMLASSSAFGLSEEELRLIQFGIAAHTHYLATSKVTGKDGKVYEIAPYADLDSQGQPLYSVWIPRWIDRQDVNGPCFVGRHYLTLIEPHEDYSSEGFYPTDLTYGMKPMLRTADVIKAEGKGRTMLEHLEMFRLSQTNATPYGKWDLGAMVETRDTLALQLGRIIGAVRPGATYSAKREQQLRTAWTAFLGDTIEPHRAVGAPAAMALDGAFSRLPDHDRFAWLGGFEQTMLEYVLWSKRVVADLDAWTPTERQFGPIEDIRTVLAPAASWMSLL